MTKTGVIPLFLAGTKGKSITQPSIKTAKEVLGKDKVFPVEEIVKVWSGKKVHARPIPFRLETLEICAAENAAAKADWRLVYNLGQSMMEMFGERGEGGKGQPCFHPTYNYHPDSFYELNHLGQYYEDVSPWIAKERKPDYQLIDFKPKPKFKKMSFDEQDRCIRGLGEKFFRTSAPVFAETIMSIFMLSGERIAENWYHWAPEKHMWGGYHVAIGRFIPFGLATMPGYEGAGHSVVVSREGELQ